MLFRSGIPDIIEEGVTGLLVPYGDVERLSGALESLLANPFKAAEMGAKGRDRVQSQFSFEQFQVRLTRVLDDVLLRKPSPASREGKS